VEISSNEKWVYMVDGYSPSEPSFVKSPLSDEEDDGIVVLSMSPLSDPKLRYITYII